MTSLDDRKLSAATQFHEDTVACAVVDQKVVTWHSLLCSGMRNYGSNKLERVVPETRLRGRTWGQDVTLAVPTTEPTVVASGPGWPRGGLLLPVPLAAGFASAHLHLALVSFTPRSKLAPWPALNLSPGPEPLAGTRRQPESLESSS